MRDAIIDGVGFLLAFADSAGGFLDSFLGFHDFMLGGSAFFLGAASPSFWAVVSGMRPGARVGKAVGAGSVWGFARGGLWCRGEGFGCGGWLVWWERGGVWIFGGGWGVGLGVIAQEFVERQLVGNEAFLEDIVPSVDGFTFADGEVEAVLGEFPGL